MEDREKRNLEKIIDQYQVDNTKKQELEKELKSKNSFIKAKLADLGEDLYETSKSKATITYQNRVSMDDEKVIEILKANCKAKDLKSVIKTKEYVDYEALESLIYNGGIAAEKLEEAQTTKVITTLTVKPLKKKEEEDD
jgi:hypothetical protein